jgi:hypothetical protein
MRAFLAAVLIAVILAMTAGAVLESFLQQRSTDAYAHPSARV